jgi:hypothetical protein
MLIESKTRINVTGVVAAAHNAIGSNAFFPGDVYKSYSGKTVEILSTDAEGRLILADALAYCVKNYSQMRSSTLLHLQAVFSVHWEILLPDCLQIMKRSHNPFFHQVKLPVNGCGVFLSIKSIVML